MDPWRLHWHDEGAVRVPNDVHWPVLLGSLSQRLGLLYPRTRPASRPRQRWGCVEVRRLRSEPIGCALLVVISSWQAEFMTRSTHSMAERADSSLRRGAQLVRPSSGRLRGCVRG